MFCGNCGKENTDDALFCEECGAPLNQAPQEEAAGDTAESPAGNETAPEAQSHAETGPGGAEFAPNFDAVSQSTRKNHWGLTFGIIGAVAAAIVVVVILLFNGIISLSRGGSGNKTSDAKDIVYMKDGTFYYVKDITKNEPVGLEFGDTRGIDFDDYFTDSATNFGRFGGSGKYFYFFSKFDEDDYEATLCRIPVSKISKDPDKNERNVEEIASGVSFYSPYVLDNDGVLFLDDDELNYFDGKEVYELADDVDSFYLSEDQKTILYLGDRRKKDNTRSLFTLPLKKNADVTEIDDGIDSTWTMNTDFFVYGKIDNKDKNTYEIYLYNGGKSSELVEEDVSAVYVDIENQEIYYKIADFFQTKAYDYVDDPYAKDDASNSEPEEMNFLVPSSQDEALSDSNKRALRENYGGDLDRFFYAYYYRTTDEGYYEVNNNGDTFYYDPNTKTWGKFDRDAYNKAWDKYYEVENRIDLRESLKNMEFEKERYQLYRYAKGKSELVSDSVGGTAYERNGVVIFPLVNEDEPEAIINIDDIGYAGEVEYLINSGDGGTWNYVFGTGDAKELPLEGRITALYEGDDDNSIIFIMNLRPDDYSYSSSGDTAVPVDTVAEASYEDEDDDDDEDEDDDEDKYEDYEGYRLVRYQIKSNSLEEDTVIAEEAWLAAVTDGTVYYFKDAEPDEADLYQWKNGKETRIAKGVAPYADSRVGSDGYFILGTERDTDGYEATLFDSKGEKVGKIADEIQMSVYLKHDRILYIKNDSLYVYNGKDSTRIDKKVNYFWSNGTPSTVYLSSPAVN